MNEISVWLHEPHIGTWAKCSLFHLGKKWKRKKKWKTTFILFYYRNVHSLYVHVREECLLSKTFQSRPENLFSLGQHQEHVLWLAQTQSLFRSKVSPPSPAIDNEHSVFAKNIGLGSIGARGVDLRVGMRGGGGV